MFRLSKEQCTTKVTCLFFGFIFAIYKYDNSTSMYIIGEEPRETNKAYVKDYLKYLSLNKRINMLLLGQKLIVIYDKK